jgi:hypothetical protein
MFKKLVLIAVVLTALLATAGPALALTVGTPGRYYVDTAYTGTELGTTKAQPFNTIAEAITAAQNNPYGGYIYLRQGTTNNWPRYAFIDTVNPPATGAPLSGLALFVMLGLASLILVATGWFLMRRSRAQFNRA